MKRYPLVRIFWFTVDFFLLVSFAAVLYSFTWEFSTRNYLKGFSDAVIPASNGPEQKAEAILEWMSHGPGRRMDPDPDSLDSRDPQDTLNYRQLLAVCGTATNAFVNLADSAGLRTRRLLLLDGRGVTKHVVVEVFIDYRWVVVDPSYRTVLRLSDGNLVTRAQLEEPGTFREVTQSIPNYPSSYSYERTVHVRVSRIPIIGKYLRGILDSTWPSWEEAFDWTLLVERESFAMLVASTILFGVSLAGRLFLSWYCARRLGIARVRLRDQIARIGSVLVNSSPTGTEAPHRKFS
jgi:hypothetical protein